MLVSFPEFAIRLNAPISEIATIFDHVGYREKTTDKIYVQVPLLLLASETVRKATISKEVDENIEARASQHVAVTVAILVFLKEHTRSSPIGPAEHDDGGSLFNMISHAFMA
ncbi:hypothetical protein MMC20_002517 [Loxospora ochrophaea]|nr:hypothetical protein [Loxospora ochrophaea]